MRHKPPSLTSFTSSIHQLDPNSPWSRVVSVFEHESLPGRPSGSEFPTGPLPAPAPRSRPEFQRSHSPLTLERSPAQQIRSPLTHSLPSFSLLRILLRVLSVTSKVVKSVSLAGDAWPNAGGPLVGHWGQQTLGLTATSPQRNLHHHQHLLAQALSPLVKHLPLFHCFVLRL